MLNMDIETVCWLIVKIREFEVEESLPVAPEDDDRTVSPDLDVSDEELTPDYLTRLREDPLFTDAKRVIDDLNVDAQTELVALAWVGRGDFTAPAEWQDALQAARDRHNEHTAEYLLGMPLAADYLEDGLEQLGMSCEGTEAWSV
jgi:hypothetical protein